MNCKYQQSHRLFLLKMVSILASIWPSKDGNTFPYSHKLTVNSYQMNTDLILVMEKEKILTEETCLSELTKEKKLHETLRKTSPVPKREVSYKYHA